MPAPRRGVGDLDGHSGRKDRPRLWEAVAELASRRSGVVSREELFALGASRAGIDAWVKRGRLHRIYRGVYAVGHTSLGREGRRLAAVLACGDGAVLSHRSAASHFGMLDTSSALIDVTARRGRRGTAGIRLHRPRSLTAADTTTHDGMPITSVARTLLDLAAIVRPDRLERAVAQAERLQLYDHRAIEDVLGRAHGHRGRAILARATAAAPKWTRSELEARFLKLVRRAGLPEPEVNAVLSAPDHPRLEADFHWPTHGLVVETDGWESHRTRSAFKRDRRKDAALIADGWRVVRFSYDDVAYDGATVVRRLRAAAAAAR